MGEVIPPHPTWMTGRRLTALQEARAAKANAQAAKWRRARAFKRQLQWLAAAFIFTLSVAAFVYGIQGGLT